MSQEHYLLYQLRQEEEATEIYKDSQSYISISTDYLWLHSKLSENSMA